MPRKSKVFKIKGLKHFILILFMLGDPGGDRTHDPQIKSLLLYQLSYEVIFIWTAKLIFFSIQKTLLFLFLKLLTILSA